MSLSASELSSNTKSDNELEYSSDPSSSAEQENSSYNSENETTQQKNDNKRLKLAADYLDNLKSSLKPNQTIQEKLDEIEKKENQTSISDFNLDKITCITKVIKHGSPSSVVFGKDDVFVGTKRGYLMEYNIEDLRLLKTIEPIQYTEEVQTNKELKAKINKKETIHCIAINQTQEMIALGVENNIKIYNTVENKFTKSLIQHKDKITALKFEETEELYSSSLDRTIKLWNAYDGTYIETFYGHQDSIYDIDSMQSKNTIVSCGGRDKTLRVWNVDTQKQLIYNQKTIDSKKKDSINLVSSYESVCFVKNDMFVGGYTSNLSSRPIINLYKLNKKNYISRIELDNSNRIYCLKSINNGDFFIAVCDTKMVVEKEIFVDGIVSSVDLVLQNDKIYIAAACAREPRLGRWEVVKTKNTIKVFTLELKNE